MSDRIIDSTDKLGKASYAVWGVTLLVGLFSLFFFLQIEYSTKEEHFEKFEAFKVLRSLNENVVNLRSTLETIDSNNVRMKLEHAVESSEQIRAGIFHLNKFSSSRNVDTLNVLWRQIQNDLNVSFLQIEHTKEGKEAVKIIEGFDNKIELVEKEVVAGAIDDFDEIKGYAQIILILFGLVFLLFSLSIALTLRLKSIILRDLNILTFYTESPERVHTKINQAEYSNEIFNHLAKNLISNQSKVQRQLEIYDQKLEEKSRSVAEEKRRLSEVLDYVKQAIFRIDENFIITPPLSVHCATVFNKNIEGRSLFEVLFASGKDNDQEHRQARSVLVSVFGEGKMQWDLLEHQLPRQTKIWNQSVDGEFSWQILSISYFPVFGLDNCLESVLFVVEDRTEVDELLSIKAENENQINDLQVMSEIALADLENYFENTVTLINEMLFYLRERNYSLEKTNVIIRKVHTLKGNSRTLRFEEIASLFHRVEELFFAFSSKSEGDSLGQLHLYDLLTEIFSIIKSKHQLAVRYFKADFELFNVLYWEIYHLFLKLDTQYVPWYFDTKNQLDSSRKIGRVDFLETVQLLAVLSQKIDEFSVSESLWSLYRLVEEEKIKGANQKVFEKLYLQCKQVIIQWLIAEKKELACESIDELSYHLIEWSVSSTSLDVSELNVPIDTPFYILQWIWNSEAVSIRDKKRFTYIYLHFQMQLGMVGFKREVDPNASLIPSRYRQIDDNSIVSKYNLFFNALKRMEEAQFDSSVWVSEVYGAKRSNVPDMKGLSEPNSVSEGLDWIEKLGYDIDAYGIRMPMEGGYWRKWVQFFSTSICQVPASVIILDVGLQAAQLKRLNSIPYEYDDTQTVSKQAVIKLKQFANQAKEDFPMLPTFVKQLEYLNVNVELMKLERLVRQLGFQLEKNVVFKVVGDGGLLPQKIVVRLYDLFSHLVRNAMDHGIENSSERKEKNKSLKGNLLLQLYQGKGSFMAALMDDGRGIDCEKLWKKAVELKWVTPDQQLSTQEKMDLIFADKLTTKTDPDLTSGRGMGMSSVRDIAKSIGGDIQINSDFGKGTEFMVRISTETFK